MNIDNHLAEALRDARIDNAHLINRLRAAGVGAFTLVSALAAFGLGYKSWEPSLVPLSAYFAIAVVLMIGGEANSKALWTSRFAVPIFDIPMVFWVQWINLHASENPGNVSEFSVGIFVVLLMLSALTLNSLQVFLTLAVAIAAEQVLEYEAEVAPAGHITSALLLSLATWICLYAGRNRIKLVQNVATVEARRRRLQRYFSPGVGELLENHGGQDLAEGKECELTVVLTDIRGFTALSEQMSGRDIITLLNAYHARMVEAVFRHGGTLDKYLGDGLLAYFNAPVGQPDHAERAFKCALEMKQGLAALNTERSWQSQIELRMGIGIHTGRAIVGDIGAPHRREFTAIGEAVNLASRLEELTKELGAEVLISSTTAELLPQGVALRKVGEHVVRGCAKPLLLFTPGEEQH